MLLVIHGSAVVGLAQPEKRKGMGVLLERNRYGWSLDDLGEELNLVTLSPAFVAEAVRRSVARWRTARVSTALPYLVPTQPDQPRAPGDGSDAARDLTLLVTRPVASLLESRCRPPSGVPQRAAACRPLHLL